MADRSATTTDLLDSGIGLGCMGMSEMYGNVDRGGAIATIHRALDVGVRLIDTADTYGLGHNEELVGEAIRHRRDDALLATKFGIIRVDGAAEPSVDARPERVASCCDDSLRRLGTDVIDLWYLHRVDPDVPIEETVGAMATLVAAGKVRMLGLSEVSAATLRRAAAVHPIAAVQSEWSLWEREIEDEVLPACLDVSAVVVAYGALGRGFLTGATRRPEDLEEGDHRRRLPRFQGENFDRNAVLADRLVELAARIGASPASVALAWLRSKGPVVPLVGTRRVSHLDDNLGCLDVALSADQVAQVEASAPRGSVAGDRSYYMDWNGR